MAPDEKLLSSMSELPDCAGVAVGLDRLVMHLCTKTTIDEVLLDDTATTNFTFSPITQKLKITSGVAFSNIKVTYTAGYATLPMKVKQGILVMISTMYNNREDVATGTTVEELPLTARRLLDSIKYYEV